MNVENKSSNYLLTNGKSSYVKVKDPVYGNNGNLIKISGCDSSLPNPQPEESLQVEYAEKLKRQIYTTFFQRPFKNLIILSGAGSSIDVGGSSMSELWETMNEKIKETKDICEIVTFDEQTKNIEAFLSKIDSYLKFFPEQKVQDSLLSEIRDKILELIKTSCTIERPSKDTKFPHKIFLEKLLQRKQTSSRVKIFTLNYDLLFEYAAAEVNAIIIDGFSFTLPRIFSGRFFDYDIVQREGSKVKEEDNFIQRVFHLHKLHGSINWERNDDKNLIEALPTPSEKPLMIYPRETKYEDSYEQPFFEMMARFQRNLRLNNDTLLIVIGYSFNDRHVNAAIEEALNQNPSFRLAVIEPQFDRDNVSTALSQIKKMSLDSERVLIVSEKFIDFVEHFPEIKTYSNDIQTPIYLNNDK